jgi:hypothetical protein
MVSLSLREGFFFNFFSSQVSASSNFTPELIFNTEFIRKKNNNNVPSSLVTDEVTCRVATIQLRSPLRVNRTEC